MAIAGSIHDQKSRRPVPDVEADPREGFLSPPPAYGPVPFYWWAGEKLERGRVAWQLDRLSEKGVRRTVVSYPHHPDGSSNLGEPALFSPEWWDFFRWFLSACRERGMTAGIQDYTLVQPALKSIGQATPGMRGGQMSCAAQRVCGNTRVRLSAEHGAIVIGAWAYPIRNGMPDVEAHVALFKQVRNGVLEWPVPAGDWFVALVFARGESFDPLHPDAGRLAIAALYEPFERECPDDFGKTLDVFFQDELDFGGRMPFWSDHLFDAFIAKKGYDLYPLLPSLWHDMGPATEKIRLDYADVVVGRMEDCYFKPVFDWHEERGVLFGHDNCGRGRISDGRAFYGDYFRTMRWYSAPGCDDPKLQGARAFKGLKVNSSIAHLYQRPRVWLEAFHSSGWGTTPEEVVAAVNEDFAYGATVVNLHGLYYSTRGGWWEWAPPDFHFRQPYWQHAEKLNAYFTRLSWLLSQGRHRCDVAIVYPITALDARPADPALCGVVAHMENDKVGGPGSEHPDAEETAFGLGRFLFDHSCDFDFIDHDSLAEAVCAAGDLCAGPARYRVLIIPAMPAVRFAMLEKALEFVRSGGVVIACGVLPRASDRAGRDDAALDGLLEKIFGSADDSADLVKRHDGGGLALFLRNGFSRVLESIDGAVDREVTASVPLQVLHRDLGEQDVYFVFNPSGHAVTADLRFRREGAIERWDPWSGEVLPMARPHIELAAREARVIVLRPGAPAAGPVADVRVAPRVRTLDGDWKSIIRPALDNRHGDFSLPPSSCLLGPQARQFRHADETDDGGDGWQQPAYDDSSWRPATCSYGPRFEVAGPFPPGTDFAPSAMAPPHGGDGMEWRPYEFSLRWGIERDPFLTDWLSGPHGLKGEVPDEFLDFQSGIPGSVWYLRSVVRAAAAGTHTVAAGARCIYQVWVNGRAVLGQPKENRPGFHAPWSIPHYDCVPLETAVELEQGDNQLLVKLVQPAGQRTRAFVAFDPPAARPGEVELRWFTGPSPLAPCLIAPPGRRAIRFRATGPPGVREIHFVSRGPARVWVDGVEHEARLIEVGHSGCHRYRVCPATSAARPPVIAIRVEAPPDSHGGDALPEPVSFVCGEGVIPTGDWCDHGLATYSGMVEYRKALILSEADLASSIRLDLGAVSATAEVRVNGMAAATLIAPPWSCDITPFVHAGENELSISVANTLANHYSVGIPTPYAFPHQTVSGLLGPVSLALQSS